MDKPKVTPAPIDDNYYLAVPPPRRSAPWRATEPSNGKGIDTVLGELTHLQQAASQSLGFAMTRKYVPLHLRSNELMVQTDQPVDFPSLPDGTVIELSEAACQMAAKLQYAQRPQNGARRKEFTEIVFMSETCPHIYSEGIRVFLEVNKDDDLGNPPVTDTSTP